MQYPEKSKKIVRNEQQDVASQCKDNPKKFWNYINSKRKTKSSVGTWRADYN